MRATPGPWTVDDELQICAYNEVIASVNVKQYRGEDAWDWDTAQANSSLICAAPDLLECCMNALGAYEALRLVGADRMLPGFSHCEERLKAAIIKTKGGK